MEQNQNPLSPNESLNPNESLPTFDPSVTLPTTLKTDAPQHSSSSSGTLTSGAALRKKYFYQQRDLYVEEHKEQPSQYTQDCWLNEARELYPKDGDYIVRDGVAMYLGIA